jgi:hypothetical protein
VRVAEEFPTPLHKFLLAFRLRSHLAVVAGVSDGEPRIGGFAHCQSWVEADIAQTTCSALNL